MKKTNKKNKILSVILSSAILFTTVFSMFTTTQVHAEQGTSGNKVYLSDEIMKSKLEESYVGSGEVTYDQNLGKTDKIALWVRDRFSVSKPFDKGIVAHAPSALVYNLTDLKGKYTHFETYLGIENAVANIGYDSDGVQFKISGSVDKKNWTDLQVTDKVFTRFTDAEKVSVDITNYNYLKLEANALRNNYFDHAVYADACLVDKGLKKEEVKEVYFSAFKYMEGSHSGWDKIRYDQNYNGGKIQIKVDEKNIVFNKGVMAHAPSKVDYDLQELKHKYPNLKYFDVYAGIESVVQTQSNFDGVEFVISGSNDNSKWSELHKTSRIRKYDNAAHISVDISDWRYLRLEAKAGANNFGDHAAWANARFVEISSAPLIGATLNIETLESLKQAVINGKTAGVKADGTLTAEYKYKVLQYEFVRRFGYENLKLFVKDNPQARNAVEYLYTHQDVLELYLSSNIPGGTYYQSMESWAKIYNAHKEDFYDTVANARTYLKIALSVAVSHSKNVYYWNVRDMNPSDPLVRYEIIKGFFDRGVFDTPNLGMGSQNFANLPISLMSWVTGNKLSDEEMEWLQWYSGPQNKNSIDAYSYINYTFDYNYSKDDYYNPINQQKWTEKYHLDRIPGDKLRYGTKGLERLYMVFEEGSVCGGLAYTYTNLHGVYGRPAVLIGQPGHAAAVALEVKNGRYVWTMPNNISGWQKSQSGGFPLGWGDQAGHSYFQVSYLLLISDAYERQKTVENALLLKYITNAFENDIDTRIELSRKILNMQSINFDGWLGLLEAYKAGNKSSEEFVKLAKEAAVNLTYYPLPMYDYTNQIMAVGKLTEQQKKEVLNYQKQVLDNAEYATSNDVLDYGACQSMAKHLKEELNKK